MKTTLTIKLETANRLRVEALAARQSATLAASFADRLNYEAAKLERDADRAAVDYHMESKRTHPIPNEVQ